VTCVVSFVYVGLLRDGTKGNICDKTRLLLIASIIEMNENGSSASKPAIEEFDTVPICVPYEERTDICYDV
jgi:hypothetical protein